jgi:hypothetical protein
MTTTTIEPEATTRIPAARPQDERAVFVTEDDRRSRALRQAAIAVGALACLWLVGLGIGTVALGRLPEVSLPILGKGGEQPTRSVDRPNDLARADQASTLRPAAARASAAPAASRRASTPSRSSRRSRARATRSTPPVAVPAAPVAPATPAPAAPANQAAQPTPTPVLRGLARRGLSAPPGQAQRETSPQAPTEPPGQARRLDDPQTSPTPPVPPGQQKPDKPPTG